MIQGFIAICLLVLAVGLFLWGRRNESNEIKREDPDVILGLNINKPEESPQQPESALVSEELSKKSAASQKRAVHQLLFVRAVPGKIFAGYELLQSLLGNGLKFGQYNFFHKMDNSSSGNEDPLFSVAAASQNGEFNLAEMGEFSCQGLSLFITLNQHIYPSVNFEMMLDTARQLAEDLDGVVLDENQKVLTTEKIQLIREKIKNFETSQMTMELFA